MGWGRCSKPREATNIPPFTRQVWASDPTWFFCPATIGKSKSPRYDRMTQYPLEKWSEAKIDEKKLSEKTLPLRSCPYIPQPVQQGLWNATSHHATLSCRTSGFESFPHASEKLHPLLYLTTSPIHQESSPATSLIELYSHSLWHGR